MLTFHAEKADLKKCICLITRLLGEEERGARLRLGGSLRKKKKRSLVVETLLRHRELLTKKNGPLVWCLHPACHGCGSVVAVGGRLLREPLKQR